MSSSNLRNMTNSQSLPLTPPKSTNYQPPPLTASYAIKALGYARIGLGAGCLLVPHFTCELFKLSISNETAAVVRMFGVRGIALGEIIINSDDKTSPDRGSRELRRVLWASVGCDLIDVCSLALAVASGHMDRLPGTLLMTGAAMAAGMGLLGLRSI